jgi:hypothetical protein
VRVAVVTGGRDHEPTAAEYRALHDELTRRDIDVVRVGCATGVDAAVYAWVRSVFVRERWRAAWSRSKKAAGPWRNRAMLAGQPAPIAVEGVDGLVSGGTVALVVLALPGGRGTADCCKAARENGITVVNIE